MYCLVVVVVSSVGVDNMVTQLREEQQTWQLVLSLYRDRLDTTATHSHNYADDAMVLVPCVCLSVCHKEQQTCQLVSSLYHDRLDTTTAHTHNEVDDAMVIVFCVCLSQRTTNMTAHIESVP